MRTAKTNSLRKTKSRKSLKSTIIALCLLITTTSTSASAKVYPAEKIGLSYIITQNYNADYAVCTSRNVREFGIALEKAELTDQAVVENYRLKQDLQRANPVSWGLAGLFAGFVLGVLAD
jgi:hypothetical protein